MFDFIRRGWFCLLLWIVLLIRTGQGGVVSYNATSRRLHLRCPEEWLRGGQVQLIGLRRQNDNLLLANWSVQHAQAMTLYDRATVINATHPHLLEVALQGVTCYDVTTYTCNMIVSWTKKGVTKIVQSQAFTFEGQVSDPVLKVQPVQARYSAGESVRVTCSAHIGNVNNSFVWETRLPGGNFSFLTDGCKKPGNITERISTNTRSASCGVTSVSSMTHVVTSDDDSREWRCRLKSTNHNAVFAVAVRCSGAAGCPDMIESPTPGVQAVFTSPKTTRQAQTSAKILITKPSEVADDSPLSLHLFIGIVSALFIVTLMVVAVMVIVFRRPPKKQQPDPSNSIPAPLQRNRMPSPFGQNRTLPQPPHYASHDDFGLTQQRQDKDDTPPPVFSNPSSSVYVSMSEIPTLPGESGGHLGKADWGSGRLPAEEGVHDRSESSYSNCETRTTRVTNSSSVGSHDSHVTMGNLKGWM